MSERKIRKEYSSKKDLSIKDLRDIENTDSGMKNLL